MPKVLNTLNIMKHTKRCNNMILVDFSGILFQNIFASISIAKPKLNGTKYNPKDFMPVAKAMILNTLFDIQTQYSPTKGDIVICLDDSTKQNWRKALLPTYKSSRKTSRDESEIPFDEVFKEIDELLQQLKENSPWKVISVPTAEADDVILCLAKHYAYREPVMIVSSDKDMIQAQKHPNVTQYSPLLKKFLTPESKGGDMQFWLTEHVLLGDAADEIPKITDKTRFSDSFNKYLKEKGLKLSESEYLEKSESEKEEILKDFNVYDKYNRKDIWKNLKFGPKAVQKLLDANEVQSFIDSNPLYRKNFERNQKLILDEYIPSEISNECIARYISQSKSVSSKSTKAFKDYLSKSGLSQLTESLPFNFVSGTISVEDFF